MFHCLPDSAWADGNLAEAAGQDGGTQKSESTQPRSQLTWDTLYGDGVRCDKVYPNFTLDTETSGRSTGPEFDEEEAQQDQDRASRVPRHQG